MARSTTTRTVRRAPRGRGGGIRDQRGVALIMVTAVIAILTAVTVEFTYRQRVNMHLAANARDALQAHYLAESAVNLSRLVLAFQQKVNNLGSIPGLSQMLGSLQGSMKLPAGVDPTALTSLLGSSGQGASGLGIRLWDLIPIDCNLMRMFASMTQNGPAGPNEGAPPPQNQGGDQPATDLAPFGAFTGGCHAEITDEQGKINVNQLNGLDRQTQAALVELMAMMQDHRYDFLFDRENRWGIRMTRSDLIVAMRDYIDPNQQQETLLMGTDGPQFVPGSGDETYYYSHYDPPYKPKNAPLDSLDELYQIPGIGDYFMAAFGDRLTVYTGKNAKMNVTPTSPADLCLKMVIAADNPVTAAQACRDPVLMTNLWQQVQLERGMMPFLGMNPKSFRSLLESNGVQVNRFIWSGPNALFGSSSDTFTIKATGTSGDVKRTIVAVVRMDGTHPLGRLLHWEEH